MKRGRLMWAAAMCALAVMVLAGYTEAGALRAAEPAPLPPETAELTLPRLDPPPETAEEVPAAETPAETAETPWEPPEDALLAVVLDETGGAGPLTVTDADGRTLCSVTPDDRGEYVLRLPPAAGYGLTAGDGRAVTFTLAENAAIPQAAGDGWTDGEQLHFGGADGVPDRY